MSYDINGVDRDEHPLKYEQFLSGNFIDAKDAPTGEWKEEDLPLPHSLLATNTFNHPHSDITDSMLVPLPYFAFPPKESDEVLVVDPTSLETKVALVETVYEDAQEARVVFEVEDAL